MWWLLLISVSLSAMDTSVSEYIQEDIPGLFQELDLCLTFLAKEKNNPSIEDLTGQISFTCETCGLIVQTLNKLNNHKHVYKTNQCDTCGRICINRAGLISHQSIHRKTKISSAIKHSNSKYICLQCTESFLTDKELNFHMKKNHPNGAKLCGVWH